MPGEGNPGMLVLKRGSQAAHLRGVAHYAMKMVEEFETTNPEIRVDKDIVLAGALCHDIGKPYEFDPVNKKRWAEDPSRAGDPCLRHSVYGAHVCLSVGLPEEIVFNPGPETPAQYHIVARDSVAAKRHRPPPQSRLS